MGPSPPQAAVQAFPGLSSAPLYPGRYLPVAPASKEARSRTAAQAEFSAAYLKRILAVQAGSGSTRRAYLTYRPLGKNLRLLGTAIRENVDLGRRVQIAADGPPSERKALATQEREWSPWVWARSSDGMKAGASHDAAQAWNELFQNPPATSGGAAAIAARRLAHPAFSEPPFSASLTEKILKLAAATCYVFTPTQPISDCIQELKAQMNWPDPSERPVLGIHIRRGDAASADAAASVPTISTRRSFALESVSRYRGHDVRTIWDPRHLPWNRIPGRDRSSHSAAARLSISYARL